MTQTEQPQSVENNSFRCRSCGAINEPPKIVEPMVLGGSNGGNFQIRISYDCANKKCSVTHQTRYNGESKQNQIIISTVDSKK